MITKSTTSPLRLERVSGPEAAPQMVSAGAEFTIGRSLQCTCTLADESVSRRHATISNVGGHWIVTDLGSRHGTILNSCRLESNSSSPLDHNDRLRIGPYEFAVRFTDAEPMSMRTMTTMADDRWTQPHIEAVSVDEQERIAQDLLQILFGCMEAIHGATNEQELTQAVLQSALAGTGYQCAALVRPTLDGGAVEVLGTDTRNGTAPESVPYSDTLIKMAMESGMVRLSEQAQMPTSMSIVQSGITSALCIPIKLENSIDAILYLDARGQSQPVEDDAAGFSVALGRMYELALGSLRRAALEQRKAVLVADLDAARAAQEMITPANVGTAGPVRYALEVRPGRYVAGDLFEIFELSKSRAAIILGDVVGKGAGAAVIMAAAQSHLYCMLNHTADPAEAVGVVNNYLARRSSAEQFVSLWAGIIDLEQNQLTYVDAGHGHWHFKPLNQPPQWAIEGGGIPMGIDVDFVYENATLPVRTGDRIILYSDGIVEQCSPDRTQFGRERVMAEIADGASPTEDLQRILQAFDAFRGASELEDDTTLASIEVL